MRIGYDGELCLPSNYGVPMSTVISFLRTPEGFVIASDGRDTSSQSRAVLSDEAQKIYPIECPGIHLAYGLAGAVRIGRNEADVTFDFKLNLELIMKKVGDKKPPNWWEYLSAVTRDLNESLCLARQISPAPFAEGLETWIFIGGFYGKHQKCAHLRFLHGASETEGEPFNHPPGFNPPFGSPKIMELVNSEDPRFLQYATPKRERVSTLLAGIERTRKDVLAHYDPEALKVDEEGCWRIGGRVQIATITKSKGFEWVEGFEPVPAVY